MRESLRNRPTRLPRHALAWAVAIVVAVAASGTALAQGTALSDRAKQRDANGNGVIDRDEARGPLKSSFDTIDADRSGTLDGAEIRNFFQGGGTARVGGGGGAALSGRAKAADKNGDGFLDKSEARGPLQKNFDKADKNKEFDSNG